MAKDKTFNLRLDAEDRERLDAIAREYSAPAATAVRILIKKEYDALQEKLAQRAVSEEFKRASRLPSISEEFKRASAVGRGSKETAAKKGGRHGA